MHRYVNTIPTFSGFASSSRWSGGRYRRNPTGLPRFVRPAELRVLEGADSPAPCRVRNHRSAGAQAARASVRLAGTSAPAAGVGRCSSARGRSGGHGLGQGRARRPACHRGSYDPNRGCRRASKTQPLTAEATPGTGAPPSAEVGASGRLQVEVANSGSLAATQAHREQAGHIRDKLAEQLETLLLLKRALQRRPDQDVRERTTGIWHIRPKTSV